MNSMIWETLECISNYAVVAMMFERCIVVFFPIHAKIIVTRRFTIALLCICILPCWVALVPFSGFILGIEFDSGWSADGVFCGWHSDRPGFMYYLWSYQLVIDTIHVVISGALVIILSTAIVYFKAGRRRVVRRDRGGESSKEYSAIVTMLLLACINVAVFVPGIITMLMSYLVDSSTWSPDAQNTLSNFGRFAYDFPCVTHSFNFIVYFCRIPSFRSELTNFLSFCISK